MYAVSKAALDKLVEAWRAEHPSIGFTRVVVGDCAGGEGDAMTEFANDWDPDLGRRVLSRSGSTRGYLSGSLIDVDHLVSAIDGVLSGGATLSIPSVTLAPPPARGDSAQVKAPKSQRAVPAEQEVHDRRRVGERLRHARR